MFQSLGYDNNIVKGETGIFFIYSLGFYIEFYFEFTFLLLY